MSAALDAYRAAMDAISTFIKDAEAMLTRSGFREEVSVPMLDAAREAISWEQAEPKRWRLVHRFPAAYDAERTDRRILIEAKVDVRRRAALVLPKLIGKIERIAADTLAVSQGKDPVIEAIVRETT